MGFVAEESYLQLEKKLHNTIINDLNEKKSLYFNSDELKLYYNKTAQYKIIEDYYLWFLKNPTINDYCQYIFGLSTKMEIYSNKHQKKALEPKLIFYLNKDKDKTGLRFFKDENINCFIRLGNTNLNLDLENNLKENFKIRTFFNPYNEKEEQEKYIDLGDIESEKIIQMIFKLLTKFEFDLNSKEYIQIITEENNGDNSDSEQDQENKEIETLSKEETLPSNTKICKICKEEKELHNYYKIAGEYEDICIKCFEKKEAAEYLEDLLKIYKAETRFNQTEFLNKYPEKEEQLNVLKETNLLSYDYENDECIIPDLITIHNFKKKYKESIPIFNENQKVFKEKIENKPVSTPVKQKNNLNSKYKITDEEGHIREKTHNKQLKFTIPELYKIKFLLKKETPIQKIAEYIGVSYANINNYKSKLLDGEFDDLIEEFENNHDLSIYSSELQETYENSFNKEKYEIIDNEGHVKKKGGQTLSLTIFDLYKVKSLIEKNISISKISNQFDVTYQTISRCVNLIESGEFDELFDDEELNFTTLSNNEPEIIAEEEKNEEELLETENLEDIIEVTAEETYKTFLFLPFNNKFIVKISCIIPNDEIVETLSIIEHLKAAIDLMIKQIFVIDLNKNDLKITMDLIIDKEGKQYTSDILNKKGFKEN